MNYLAHAYLSFGHPGILAGNLVSDFVKGRKKFDFPPHIRKGITLHRQIDEFTDTHPATRAAKEIFRPHYRLYSGALVDVIYDHYLANDQNEFQGNALYEFSQTTYQTVEPFSSLFPPGFATLFPYMKKQNWLYNYRTREGTGRSLGGVVYRAVYLTESETAFQLFQDHYQLFQECYRQFWVDAKPFIRQQFDLLLKEENG